MEKASAPILSGDEECKLGISGVTGLKTSDEKSNTLGDRITSGLCGDDPQPFGLNPELKRLILIPFKFLHSNNLNPLLVVKNPNLSLEEGGVGLNKGGRVGVVVSVVVLVGSGDGDRCVGVYGSLELISSCQRLVALGLGLPLHMDASGTLSWEDFRIAAQFVVDKWKTVIDDAQSPWSWVPSSSASALHKDDEGVRGYLSLENICLLKPCEKERDPNHIEEEVEVEEDEAEEYEDCFTDAVMLVQRHDMTLRHYDLHILYSDSYRVPVLFFRAYFNDGCTLHLDDIEKNLPLSHAKEFSDSKWTFITLEEHPYLNRPWYKLHPCGTSEWMKLLYLGDSSSTDRNEVGVELYLLSWLSVVGPMVGLKVPIKAAKQLIDRS